tara:strand:+ start:9015 stop:9326 length:312 start_codon:yes stop_codon:yes gene_type:complete
MIFSGLLVYAIFLTCILFLSIFFNIKFISAILKVQDSVEESLDILDQTYASVTKILGRPVFFDSVEVRQVISEINKSRESILYVANVLGQVEVADKETNEETY